MKKDEVVDLSGRRKQAKFNALMSTLDPEKLFAIPMEDVDQFLDSANDSKEDPVILGPSALTAVKRLFPNTASTTCRKLWVNCTVLSTTARHCITLRGVSQATPKMTRCGIRSFCPSCRKTSLNCLNRSLHTKSGIWRHCAGFTRSGSPSSRCPATMTQNTGGCPAEMVFRHRGQDG